MIEIESSMIVVGRIQAKCLDCDRRFSPDRLIIEMMKQPEFTAQSMVHIQCPYCGQMVYVTVQIQISQAG